MTRIPARSLEYLESGQFEKLPADVFVRGFLRSYARCVGLDVDETIRRYTRCGMTPAPVASPLADELASSMAKLEEQAPTAAVRRVTTVPATTQEATGASPSDVSPEASGEGSVLATSSDESAGTPASNDDERAGRNGRQDGQGRETGEVIAAASEMRWARAETSTQTEGGREAGGVKRRRRRRKRKQRLAGAAPASEAARPAKADAHETQDASAAPDFGPSEQGAAASGGQESAAVGPAAATVHEVVAPAGEAPSEQRSPAAEPVSEPVTESATTDSVEGAEAATAGGAAAAGAPGRGGSARSGARRASRARKPQAHRPVLVIDDDRPEDAERIQQERAERADASWRSFLPPSLLDNDEGSHRGALTLAVIILVIVATLTMSYLLRRPSGSGDGITYEQVGIGAPTARA